MTQTKVLVFVCFYFFDIVLLLEIISILWISTIHIRQHMAVSKSEYLDPYIV